MSRSSNAISRQLPDLEALLMAQAFPQVCTFDPMWRLLVKGLWLLLWTALSSTAATTGYLLMLSEPPLASRQAWTVVAPIVSTCFGWNQEKSDWSWSPLNRLSLTVECLHISSGSLLFARMRPLIRVWMYRKCPLTLPVVLEAVTPCHCCQNFSYERLEAIGDAYLKYAASLSCYLAFPLAHEGKVFFHIHTSCQIYKH